ncbi:hypothetical protein GGR57DRAFT_348399 [Xylariaceae sp. FL1272]|nr:hypothetical protein GGR57DRAFT_348399 [Xylariaceae sp. FL1272]
MATAPEPRGASRGELDADGDITMSEAVGPQPMDPVIESVANASARLETLSMRAASADPDAQATITDFLDFTEYLPADISRSLTGVGKLDGKYIEASTRLHELTDTWRKLPTLPADQRPDPVQLRADISECLNRTVSSRAYARDEAVRIHEYINKHFNRAQNIVFKLREIYDNWPTTEEQELLKSPVQTKSPGHTRPPKITFRTDNHGQKVRHPPRITIPGEVLAPYEVDFNNDDDFSDDSSEDEISVSPPRTTTAQNPRIKLVNQPKTPKQKLPKPPRPSRPSMSRENMPPVESTSTALAKLRPPPENAVIGSPDAPWLQLTQWELAKLRKRMKKNSAWIPSSTMINRELKNVGRGLDEYRAAKKKAEEEGKPFEAVLPALVTDAESGKQHPPEGAISADSMTADEVQLSNRGMKLNEAKKLKRETLARQAAEEAEESARKMEETARSFFTDEASPSVAGSSHDNKPKELEKPKETGQNGQSNGKASGSSKSKGTKRKRDSSSVTPVAEKPPGVESQPQNPVPAPSGPPGQPDSSEKVEKPPAKRTKTETPIPPPQLTPRPLSVPPQAPAPASTPAVAVETPVPVPKLGRTILTSKTPVPVPVPAKAPSDSSIVAVRTAASSGHTSPAPPSTVTTTIPTKPPAETPIPPPIKTSTTPILPPARDLPKRETRQTLQTLQPVAANPKQSTASRGNTPVSIAAPEPPQPPQAPQPPPPQPTMVTRRPVSRGKAASQEPPPTLAMDRPRRASTARNTPAPEARQPSKRAKRPAPGVVTTNSGGTSAIGKRKAAPRKKARGNPKKDKGANQQPEPEVEVEVDDDGNVIDPDEPRYCLCNRVSFGTMISCDNVDGCEKEWFHLECVGLSEIPARTTKWYCPQCRILLNLGERGEVTSRGVKM